MINVCLRDREAVLKAYTDSPEQLFDLFSHLEAGPDVMRFPRFEDEDGEVFQLNPAEVVWVSAPTHLVEEGRLRNDDEAIDGPTA